jgi:hypothetical protein
LPEPEGPVMATHSPATIDRGWKIAAFHDHSCTGGAGHIFGVGLLCKGACIGLSLRKGHLQRNRL